MKKIELKELCIKKGIDYGNYKKKKIWSYQCATIYYVNIIIFFLIKIIIFQYPYHL